MLKNYLKIAYRNLLKNKVFSLINILGLAIGMAACLLILQYVSFELSYDRFHTNADNIYRVQHNRYVDGELQYQKAQAFIPTGEAMINEYPEVMGYTTLFPISEQSDIIISHQNQQGETIRFAEDNIYHAKGSFLEIFSLAIVEGQKELSFLPPNSVIISESAAQKYFGNASPIGKVLRHNYSEEHKIIGVFEDLPQNTHLKFDFVFSWQQITGEEQGGDENNWWWDGFFTYLILSPRTDVAALETKFPDLVKKYQGDENSGNNRSEYVLQPITNIHLHSQLKGEAEPNGSAQIVYILLGVSLFILVLAWINYINLSTSHSLSRIKEIGIRKAIGSQRRQLIIQFLLESLLVNLLALAVALTVVQIFYSTFSEFAELGSFEFIQQKEFWVIAVTIVVIGSIGAGLYPAWIISSYQPVQALRSRLGNTPQKSFLSLRHGLTIFQFTTSITLIIGSFVVYEQLSLMKTRDLRIDIDNTLVINTQATFGPPGSDSLFTQSLSALKNQLSTYSAIQGVTASYDIPGKEHLSSIPNFRHTENPEELVFLYFTRIDYDFIPTFDIQLVAGRNFLEGTDNQTSIMMNLEAVEALGFVSPQDAIGQEVIWGNDETGRAKVVGVVDFRSTSFKNKNYPIAFTPTFFPFKYLSIQFAKTRGENVKEQIALVEDGWQAAFPDLPFEYFFLDDFFNQQYKEEQKFSQLLGIFTLLGVTIACLGLYAIAWLSVLRRTKEVGVRKVLGASAQQIVQLLSKDFVQLVLIAGVIALPVAYLGMNTWLTNYTTRISLHWWLFLIPMCITVFIALLTISFQTIKAALANPADSLKYE